MPVYSVSSATDRERHITLQHPALYGRLHFMSAIRAGLCMLIIAASTARAAAPYPTATGIWNGQYNCAQGNTALELDVSLLDPTHIQALFYFHALPGNPFVPNGCFLMQGSFDNSAQTLNLAPTKWLLQPFGYVWVSLAGSIGTNGILAGDIAGPGCSVFSLARSAVGAQMPAACQSPASLGVS